MAHYLDTLRVKKYEQETGLEVLAGVVRKENNKRVDLFVKGGKIIYYWPLSGKVIDSTEVWN